MFKKNKIIAALGAVAMSIGLFAGCGSSSASKSDEGLGTTDKPITLTFWTWQPTDAQWKRIYSVFNKKYPNIKIKWWRTSEMSDYQKNYKQLWQEAMAQIYSEYRLGLLLNNMVVLLRI